MTLESPAFQEPSVSDLVDAHLARMQSWTDLSRRQGSRLDAFAGELARRWRRGLIRRVPLGWPSGAGLRGTGLGRLLAAGAGLGRPVANSLAAVGKPLGVAALVVTTMIALKLMFPVGTDAMVAAIVGPLPIYRETVDEIGMVSRCAERKLVIDRAGGLAGTMPLDRPACADRSLPFMTAAVPEHAAQRWTEAIEALEGRSLKGPRSLLGVFDIAALKRLAEYWGGVRPDVSGSPPLLSAIEVVLGRSQGLGVREKIGTLIPSAIYAARHLRSDAARSVFMASHLPCIRGAPGGRYGLPVAGAVCSWLLFAKPPEEAVSLGEACLLAGAMGFQILAGRPDMPEESRSLTGKSLARAKRRARTCIARLARPDGETRAAVRFVEAYELPDDVVPGKGRHAAPGLDVTLRDHLRLANASAHPGTHRLTIDGAVQSRARSSANAVLEGLSDRLASGLCYGAGCARRPDVLIALAEVEDDRLAARVVISNRHELLHGPIGRREGRYLREPAHLSLGSLSKVPLVFVIARSGETRLCDKAFGGLQNPDGGKGVADCADGRGSISTWDALRKSLNLPIIDLLRRRPDGAREMLAGLGFHVREKDSHDTFAVGAVLGFGATAAPEHYMQLFGALLRGREGAAARMYPLALFEGEEGVEPLDLDKLGLSRSEIAEAARLLNAPLRPGGTLSALQSVLADRGCSDAIGKSGTPETSRTVSADAARAKVAVAAFRCGERRFVAFAMIGAPGGADLPVGRISGNDTAVLIGTALGAVLAHKAPRPKP